MTGSRRRRGGSDPAPAVLKPQPTTRARVVPSQLAKSGKNVGQ